MQRRYLVKRTCHQAHISLSSSRFIVYHSASWAYIYRHPHSSSIIDRLSAWISFIYCFTSGTDGVLLKYLFWCKLEHENQTVSRVPRATHTLMRLPWQPPPASLLCPSTSSFAWPFIVSSVTTVLGTGSTEMQRSLKQMMPALCRQLIK